MNTKLNCCLFWSGGKDAALSLYYLQKIHVPVKYLVTTINTPEMLVAMHRIPLGLLEQQARALEIPLQTIRLAEMPDMETYERQFNKTLESLKACGIDQVAFGDIFLEDLREYREKLLAPFGLKSLYPLWQKDSKQLLQEFLAAGFKAIVICVNARLLDESFVGKELNEEFLNALPEGVDPCGENGEFHTFVYDGPCFKQPLSFQKGDVYLKDYGGNMGQVDVKFWYQELLVTEKT